MAYKDYRINTKINSDEQVLKVNLKRGIDTFKILSLTISTEDTYQYPSADYGVIVGRVLANNAFGVPNVKVSVFVPLSSEDEDSDGLISQIYPFKTVNSVDGDNVAYNLIQTHPYTGIDGAHTTKGTFPSKRLVLDNDTVAESYDKYWQYTTVTNEAGDYMIFGVPTGNCQVHFDCDLSDIGMISQRPYDFINKGYSADLFKSATEFKDDEDVNSCVHILSQDTTVFVYPFWGDKKKNQIGITRNDLNLNYTFEPSCVFIGSSITDPDGTYFSVYGQPTGSSGRFKTLATSAGDIEVIRKTEDGVIEELKENVKGIIDGNGVWCYSIPMNLDRIGMDEEGNIIPIHKPNCGIPTRARMRMRITLTSTNSGDDGAITAKMLIPNNPPIKKYTASSTYWGLPVLDTSKISREDYENYYEFGSKTPDICFRDFYWGKVYSIKQYYPRLQYDRPYHNVTNTVVDYTDYGGYPIRFAYPFSCISSIDSIQGFNPFPYTTMYAGAENWNDAKTMQWFMSNLSEYASNNGYTEKGLHFCFENDWINGCLYFPKCQVLKQPDNTYLYFGVEDKYDYIVYTGRHNCRINGSTFTTRQYDTYPRNWHVGDGYQVAQANDQDNTSIYSHVHLTNGILEKKTNNLNQTIFYYRGGREEQGKDDWRWEAFYATDIIVLGNLVDIYDSLPKLYQNLPVTTATFPPIVPPKDLSETGMNRNGYTEQLTIMYHGSGYDTDNVDIYGNFNEPGTESNVRNHKHKHENFDNINEYFKTTPGTCLYLECSNAAYKYGKDTCSELIIEAEERYALFFGYKVKNCPDFLVYFVPSFVNTSRICELDVKNNSYKSIRLANIPINGCITRRDISTPVNRSEFASMNHDINAYVIDSDTQYRRFKPKNLEIVDFDGRLKQYLENRKYTYIDEELDKSYVLFRYGYIDGPMRYFCTRTTMNFVYRANGSLTDGIENNEDLPLPVNSFYFYFGLRSGMSALDVFDKKYGIKSIEDETTNKSNCITVAQNTTYNCTENGKEYYTGFKISTTVPSPYNIVIKKGNSVKYRKNKTYSRSFGYYLQPGSYTIQLTDVNGIVYTKRFNVSLLPISIETIQSNRQVGGVETFFAVITKIGTLSDTSGLVFSETTKDGIDGLLTGSFGDTYFIWFDEPFTLVDSKEITTVNSGMTLTGHIAQYPSTTSDKPCQTDKFYIKFAAPTSDKFYFSGIPIGVLKPWSESWGSGGDSRRLARIWDSQTTQNITNKYCFDNSMTIQEQYSYLSKMINIVYGGGLMTLSYDPEITNYAPNVITPNVNTLSEILNNEGRIWSGYAKDCSAIKSQQALIINPTANNSVQFPHIIGQNFPIEFNSLTCLSRSKGGTYEDNKYYNINDGANTYLVNCDYFDFIHEHDSNKDKPDEIHIPIRFNSEVNGLNVAKTSINMFGVQTMDKRLDYQIVLKTPSILPSGYNRFSLLSTKCVSSGSLDATIYGGIRLNKDSSNNVTSYTSSSGILTGSPNNSAQLYSQFIVEDSNTTDISYTEDKKYIWNTSYNDEVAYKATSLTGNTGLHMSFVSCGAFDTGIVRGGDTMNVDFSYNPGATIIHKTEISSDDYDVLYSGSTYDSSYDICGSFKGSSLAFKIAKDTLYNGVTYTDINVNKANPVSISSSVVSPHSTSKSLCVMVNNTAYAVDKIICAEASNFEKLTYDDTKCYYPTYGEDNENLLSDENAANCYNFKLATTNAILPSQATITIPTRKLYTEHNNSLLRQAIVYNTGYSYYANKLSVNHAVEDGKLVQYITLYVPINSNGRINFGTMTTLSGYTIGDMVWYCKENEQVEYDYEWHRFKIPYSVGATGETVLYFTMTNGLKYKVVAPINQPNVKYKLTYSTVTPSSGDSMTVKVNSLPFTSGNDVLRGSDVLVTVKADANRLAQLTINDEVIEMPEEGENKYRFNITSDTNIVATFTDKPEVYNIPCNIEFS